MKISLIVCLLLLMGAITDAQPAKRLSNIIADNDIPGVQLAYLSNGKTILYNLGKAPDNKSVVESSTIYRAGSLGKTVFAYAVLRLQDKGLINIDTPLLHYIGTYNKFDPKDARYKKITARMVLSHTSGLEFYGDPIMSLIAEPGKVFSYSSGGYYFLQQVVEKLTDKPLEVFMQQEVLKPLGMMHSTYTGEGDEPNASFSFKTTAADYSKFLQALLTGNGLKRATAKLMLSTHSDAQWLGHDTTKADDQIDWGLGVGLQRNEKGKSIWHWGSVMMNFNSFYIANLGTKNSLVYFTNSVSGLRAAPEIIDLFIGRQTTWATQWLKLGYDKPATMEALHMQLRNKGFAKAGEVFKSLSAAGFKFSERDIEFFGNALHSQGKPGAALAIFKQNQRLYPNSAAVYANLAGTYLKLGNKPQALANYRASLKLDTGNVSVAYHIKALKGAIVPTTHQLQAFAGKYKLNVMDGIFMDVTVKGTNLSIDFPGGRPGTIFSPVSQTEFLDDESGFTLKFNIDSAGKVKSVLIHTKNTVDVWERVDDLQ